MSSSLFARLQKQLDDVDLGQTETWDPAVGDSILGTIVRVGMRTNRFGEFLVAEIQKVDGKVKQAWATATMLRQLFDEHSPKVGDIVGIKRLDDGVGKQAYKRYHMFVVRQAQVEAGATDLDGAGEVTTE